MFAERRGALRLNAGVSSSAEDALSFGRLKPAMHAEGVRRMGGQKISTLQRPVENRLGRLKTGWQDAILPHSALNLPYMGASWAPMSKPFPMERGAP
jgi:hypothetical protein